MYSSGAELIKLAQSENKKIYEVVIENECILKEKSVTDIRNMMRKNLEVMKESSETALHKSVKSVGGLIGKNAEKLNSYAENNKTICGYFMNKAMARAYSCSEVNASMGKIVAAPTAGSCGIIPAAIITTAEINKYDDEKMIDALFTASGIGQIIGNNATLSGAEGGCQAECGSAAAMAAGAVVEMLGGTPHMVFDAAAIAIKNVMGLVCDPVAGLVEEPCAKRNASGVINALICADMCLAGINSIIPFDEVVCAMYKTGRSLPYQLKETALGGIAATPSGKRIKNEIYNKK